MSGKRVVMCRLHTQTPLHVQQIKTSRLHLTSASPSPPSPHIHTHLTPPPHLTNIGR